MADDVVQTLDHEPSDRVEIPARFAPGTTIGHFRVVRELGAGGMGVVFEAHDPDLDRRVAIKVVKDLGAGSAAGLRLIREAQAMARLTHPNVVAVHEVGTIADQVFVVMELVPGTTLAEWLKTPRTWREIIETFLAAAQGLLAAHHAGLVHRDFKPSNVLVGPSTRVRVSDFGLAHLDELAEGSEPIAGTIGYMAPEQRAGGAVDARADQYAFAIALQDALRGSRVPRRIRTAIVRALSIDPEARFATLDELAHELRAPLHSKRRALIVALGASVVLGIAGYALLDNARGGEVSCADGADLVDRVWNPPARVAQVAHFNLVHPDARVAIAGSTALVDDWALGWKLGRRAACSIAEPQRSARLSCLDRELHALRAQLAVWRTADAAMTDGAVRSAASLPDVDACAAEVRDGMLSPIVLDQTTETDALVRSGRAPDAQRGIAAMLSLAETTGNPRDLASALLSAGRVENEAGVPQAARDHLARAAQEAARGNDDKLLLDALVAQASATNELGRAPESLGLLDAAAAIDQRAGGYARFSIEEMRGDTLMLAGRTKEAITTLSALVPEAEARSVRDPKARLALSTLLGELAGSYGREDQWAKANELDTRCVALDEANFGSNHPELAKSLADLATTEAHLERFKDSAAHVDRADRILTAVFHGKGLLSGKLALQRANLDAWQNHVADARVDYERARTVLASVLPADHPYFENIEEGLAGIERRSDHCKDAIPHIERALHLIETNHNDARQHALQLTEYGACLADVGRNDEARVAIDRSLGELDEIHAALRWYAEPRAMLADLEWAAGHHAKAIELVHAAIAAGKDDPSSDTKDLVAREHEELAEWGVH
jgi:eukaryotic-like serine/threonine-protein kinase